jgi:hypothetical protein
LQRRPDSDEQRFLSAVQHVAAVLRDWGRGEDVLVALGELLETAGGQRAASGTGADNDRQP